MVARLLERIRKMYCGMHGHDSLLHFEKDRMCLQCASCGYQSPGWEIGERRRPAVRARGDIRWRAARPHLVSGRRAA